MLLAKNSVMESSQKSYGSTLSPPPQCGIPTFTGGKLHIRVYAQPYYVLRQAKYYVEGKKGVCATYYVLRKLKKDKVTNRCNIICSLLNRNLSVVDDNLKRNKQI